MKIKRADSQPSTYTKRRTSIAGSSVSTHNEERIPVGRSKSTGPLPDPEYLALSLDSSEDAYSKLKQLWVNFRSNGNIEARNGIAVYYHRSVVEETAGKVAAGCTSNVEAEDLAQSAALRLLETIGSKDFDPGRGDEAEHYIGTTARWGMLQSLRESHWIPVEVRRENRKANDAEGHNLEESARPLKLPCFISTSDYPGGEIANRRFSHQETSSRRKEDALRNAISQLPPGEQEVVRLYYYHSYSRTEISRETGMTKSTVSSMLTAAERNLREKLTPLDLSRGELDGDREQGIDRESNQFLSPALIEDQGNFSDGSKEEPFIAQTIAYFRGVMRLHPEVLKAVLSKERVTHPPSDSF